ncbi:hypothetical protein WDU99_08985 [Microbacterium sp. Mu-80]|uniref:Ig-like domain-containing protein n=1 Tax=Microbacterium bandirmense TaxID=3122050 RepID=A0ABU8LBR9_9MICO
MKKKLFATGVAMAIGMLVWASPAHAEESPVHPDVAYAMSAVPGGLLVDANTVVWPALDMQLSATPTMLRSVGTCATGQYCAYSKANRGGTKLSWTTCATVSTAALSSVGSIANARSSGTVQARTSSGTILASASAGTSVNVFGAVRSLRCIS